MRLEFFFRSVWLGERIRTSPDSILSLPKMQLDSHALVPIENNVSIHDSTLAGRPSFTSKGCIEARGFVGRRSRFEPARKEPPIPSLCTVEDQVYLLTQVLVRFAHL